MWDESKGSIKVLENDVGIWLHHGQNKDLAKGTESSILKQAGLK